MTRAQRTMTAVALLAVAGACGGSEEPAVTDEPGEAAVAPDRAAPAISNPASPTPVGTDVGTVERDTSGGVVADDSVALPGR